MKKFIQICSIFSLLFLFSAASTQAQSFSRRFEGKIPFNFNVGQKSYQAGDYVIRIAKDSARNNILTLEDYEGNVLYTGLVMESGDLSKTEPQLIFNCYENQRFLSKLATNETGFSIAMTRTEKQVARQYREKSSGTQIALLKPSK